MSSPAGPGRRGWISPTLGIAVLGGVALLLMLNPEALGHTLGKPAEPITHFLLAVAVILLVCHLIGAVFRRFGQPAVLGEIVGKVEKRIRIKNRGKRKYGTKEKEEHIRQKELREYSAIMKPNKMKSNLENTEDLEDDFM